MRGTISAGMAFALFSHGYRESFDAVYGACAGAIAGAWLLSDTPERIAGWADPQRSMQAIAWRNLPSRRPYVDVGKIIEDIYVRQYPLNWDSVLSSPIPLHPLATSVTTGHSTDLHPFINSPEELRTALRTSCTLPVVSARPVSFAGDRLTDAGVSEALPMATAVGQGATHVLVLCIRDRAYLRPPAATGVRRTVARQFLRMSGYGERVFEALQGRAEPSIADQGHLGDGVIQGPVGPVALAAVWPADDLAQPSRTEHDGDRLREAFDGGARAFERSWAVIEAG